MREHRIVVAVIIALVLYGAISFVTMPRQEFPDFTIRQGLVVGVMPGADSHQVEERLTRPVEQYLFSFKEVNKAKTYSLSQEGRVIVFVELNEDIHGPDAPAFWAKLRHGLNELRTQSLPTQVLALVGNNDFGDTSALLLTVVSEGHSLRDVEKQLRVIEDHLRRIPATSKLRRFGEQQEMIRVTIDQQRLARYAIKPASIWAALQGIANVPAGFRVDGTTLELPIHVSEVLKSEQTLGETILMSEPTGAHVRLRDVATIAREYGHDDSMVRFNGKNALVLSVEMRLGNDITQYGREVDAALEEARRELPASVQISRVADQPKTVRTSINHFLRDFAIAIGCVIGVSMLLLPLRVASVAAVTIPVSILITMGVLNALGVDLQQVSLAGLVVVLGMVVDNAIVVVDDHVERLDHGASPWTAAFQSAHDLFIPMLVATAAIIMAYVPNIWFLTGQAADFVRSLPLTIAVALTVSLILAVTLVPLLDFWFIKKGLHDPDVPKGRPSILDLLNKGYGMLLERAFRHPLIVIVGVGAGSVALAMGLAVTLEQQLFPKVDRDQFAVEVYLPAGRALRQTDAIVSQIEKELMTDKRITNVTAFIGTSSPRFHALYAPEMPNRNYAQLIVNTISQEKTIEVLREYSKRFDGRFPDAWVRWKQLDMQAAKAPVEIRVSGDDISVLKAMSERIKEHARSLPGATWVRDDYDTSRCGVQILPDKDACSRLGVTPSLLQLSLAMDSNTGVPLGTIWEGDYPVRIILGQKAWHEDKVEDIRDANVPAALVTAAVPLRQVASVKPSWDEGTIVRRNGVRTMTVRIDLAMGLTPTEFQKEMERFVDTLGVHTGVRVTYGGERQDQEEQYPPMLKSLLTSVALIYFILLLQFGRHLKALLVMLTMPLALLGAVVGLASIRAPFGFTSFVGVISLMGIVVRNGIILVDYAETLRNKNGMSAKEAAIAAGKRRMRPIFLTSAAAAVGVIPLILSGSTLWAPLGAVTAYGLMFSMVLTLFVLPVAYWLVAKLERKHENSGQNASVVISIIILCVVVLPSKAQEVRLTLNECRELAARQSSEVKIAELEITSSEHARLAARTHFFPQVSANAVSVRSGSPLATMETPSGIYDVLSVAGAPTGLTTYVPGGKAELAKHIDSASISLIQPVYAGGRIANGNRLAREGVSIAQEGSAIAKRDAVAQAEEKYWKILQLQDKLRTLVVFQSLLDELQRQADDAALNGLTTSNDPLKVKVQRSKTEVDRMKLESGIRISIRDLRRHLGLPEGDDIILTDDFGEPSAPASDPKDRVEGSSRRPEIRQLEHVVRAHVLQTELKKGEMLPSVSVGASAQSNRVLGLKNYNDALVFAMVQIPVTGAWEHAHDRAAARRKQMEVEERLADARRKVRLEIEKRWDDLSASWLAIRTANTAIEQADVNLKENTDLHKAGLVTLSDLLEAHVIKHQSQDQKTDAKTEYWINWSAYRRAVGIQK